MADILTSLLRWLVAAAAIWLAAKLCTARWSSAILPSRVAFSTDTPSAPDAQMLVFPTLDATAVGGGEEEEGAGAGDGYANDNIDAIVEELAERYGPGAVTRADIEQVQRERAQRNMELIFERTRAAAAAASGGQKGL